jgi:hypothetical protein
MSAILPRLGKSSRQLCGATDPGKNKCTKPYRAQYKGRSNEPERGE